MNNKYVAQWFVVIIHVYISFIYKLHVYIIQHKLISVVSHRNFEN